jgi:hypothetical protein
LIFGGRSANRIPFFGYLCLELFDLSRAQGRLQQGKQASIKLLSTIYQDSLNLLCIIVSIAACACDRVHNSLLRLEAPYRIEFAYYGLT